MSGKMNPAKSPKQAELTRCKRTMKIKVVKNNFFYIFQNPIKMMHKLSDKEQKIAQLIYSGEPANDLLALELIKHSGVTDGLYPLVLSVILTSKDRAVKQAYQPFFKNQQLDKATIFRIMMSRDPNNLIPALSNYSYDISTMAAYAVFRRGPFGRETTSRKTCNTFLYFSNKDHPHRKEVFNEVLKIHTDHSTKMKNNNDNRIKNNNRPLPHIHVSSFIGLYSNEILQILKLYDMNIPLILSLSHYKERELPKQISNFEVESLTVEGSFFDEFPQFVFQLPGVKKMRFRDCSLYGIPKDWSVFKKLESLTFSRNNFVFEDFDFADSIPNLQNLHLGENKIRSPYHLIRKKKLPLSTFAFASDDSQIVDWQAKPNSVRRDTKEIGYFKQRNSELLTIAAALGRSVLKEEEKRKYLDLLSSVKTFENLPPMELEELLLLLNVNYTPLKNELQKRINALTGKQDAKETSTSENITNDKVLRLIQNEESSKVLLGLQMLETGGVPENLLGPLLVVQKTCQDIEVAKVAKKLLEENAPPDWLPIINDKLRFSNILTDPGLGIALRLIQLAKNTSRYWAASLSVMFYERYQKGLRYIPHQFPHPCQERTMGFNVMVKDNHLDFHSALGFSDNRQKNPLEVRRNDLDIPNQFPLDIIEHYPDLESIDCHHCQMNHIPIGIGKFKKLKHLDLSNNFFSLLPEDIEFCTELESIELYLNDFVAFPMSLTKLPKLKKIDLRFNSENHTFKTVEIPEAVRIALPDCEILV